MQPALKLTEPIAPQLVALLRRRIAAIDLPPGAALSEKDIAARFNVSRQPVREAFIKLSEAGLVEIRPSRGTWVMKISVREVCNARFVREADRFDATVKVTKDDMSASGTSILSLMMLAAGIGSVVRLEASGREAEPALAALIDLVRRGFDEE